MGGYANDKWASVGWFAVAPGACATPGVAFGANPLIYVRVEQAASGLVWEGDTEFCIDDEAFLMLREDCARQGGSWAGFFVVDLGSDLHAPIDIQS